MAEDLSNMTGALVLADVADRAGVTVQTVRKWIASGVSIGGRPVRLAALRVGGRIRVTEASLSQFLSACNPKATAVESPAAIVRRGRAARDRVLAQLRGGKL